MKGLILIVTLRSWAGQIASAIKWVASSSMDPSLREPQRYGTQGHCTGAGTWEPWPCEDPARLDERRASVGLEPEAAYIARFKDICH